MGQYMVNGMMGGSVWERLIMMWPGEVERV